MIDSEERDGKRLTIYQDPDPVSPREWDNLGIFADWHRRDEIGDRKVTDDEMRALKRGGFPLLARYLRRTIGATHVTPVGMLDHSGITIWIGGGAHWSDAAGWDSGTVGFIYTTPELIAACGTPEDRIDEVLAGEIEELDQYFRGDVYGYVIKRIADGAPLDTCWGFFGFDYAQSEARAALANTDTYPDDEQRDWVKSFTDAYA